MRAPWQIRARHYKAKTANKLLAWLQGKNLTTGGKVFEVIITPFAKENQLPLWEIWQAWDFLKETKRRVRPPGKVWEVVSFEGIFMDKNGDVV